MPERLGTAAFKEHRGSLNGLISHVVFLFTFPHNYLPKFYLFIMVNILRWFKSQKI